MQNCVYVHYKLYHLKIRSLRTKTHVRENKLKLANKKTQAPNTNNNILGGDSFALFPESCDLSQILIKHCIKLWSFDESLGNSI